MANETMYWIDVTGQIWNLSDPTTYYTPYPGMDSPHGMVNTVVSYVVPGYPGDREQYIQIMPNDIKMPLTIFGNTQADVDINRRALQEAMRASRGQGKLRHLSPDNTTRELNCREISGMRTVSNRAPGYLLVGLEFRAADPYWYDTDYTTVLATPGALLSFFASPTLPLKLSPGGLSSGFTVENIGQAEAWPLWTITGPGVSPTLTNSTTGEVLASNISLSSGQVLTIDTRPGIATVTREDGSNQWPTISSTSVLWSLQEGANAVVLGMTGTSSASALQLQFKNRWEGV